MRITRTRAEARTATAPFVLVGGVPGAGKSTALQRLAPLRPGVRVLDSDTERRWFARHVRQVPYRVLRPLVHLIHHLRVLVLLLAGPRHSGALVVHDPSTRWVRLGLVGRLAQLRGWSTSAIFVDVSRLTALAGQQERGRTVGRRRFQGHWGRWQRLRAALGPRGEPAEPRWSWALTPWRTRKLTTRVTAAHDLLEALAATSDASPFGRRRVPSVGRCLMEVDD